MVLSAQARHSTIREKEIFISPRKLLGKGRFGEVHEVRRSLSHGLRGETDKDWTGNLPSASVVEASG